MRTESEKHRKQICFVRGGLSLVALSFVAFGCGSEAGSDAAAIADAAVEDSAAPRDARGETDASGQVDDGSADAGVGLEDAQLAVDAASDADAATGADDANVDAGLRDAMTDATLSQDSGAVDAATCVAESNITLCARLGASCGALSAADNCGVVRSVSSCGACAATYVCAGNACVSSELTATTAQLVGDGLSNCGSGANESCARSLPVQGGRVLRGTDSLNPATVSDFQLDKYEVTVGRFRKFVDEWVNGWRPAPRSGRHTHLNAGAGLSYFAINEPGWVSSWDVKVAGGARSRSDWDSYLKCDARGQTWTVGAGPNEAKPIDCLDAYAMFAFCVWDGGFLPSEAEFEYAAAGGAEERPYPWGSTAPQPLLAVYNKSSPDNVGNKPAGVGRFGQLDLAGNVKEFVVDALAALVNPCADCVNLASTTELGGGVRGGAYVGASAELQAASRSTYAREASGGRCARRPAAYQCTPESDTELCGATASSCGTMRTTDRCGVQRSIDCGRVSGSTTVPQTDTELCGAAPSKCGTWFTSDRCSRPRSPDCGTAMCLGPGVTCGGGGTQNACGCTNESNAQICARLGANCGSLTTSDNCGNSRTVTCGTTICSGAGVTCGGGGAPNVCGCTPESDVSFCARQLGCGTKTGTDNCGRTRTANCRPCADLEITAVSTTVTVQKTVTASSNLPALPYGSCPLSGSFGSDVGYVYITVGNSTGGARTIRFSRRGISLGVFVATYPSAIGPLVESERRACDTINNFGESTFTIPSGAVYSVFVQYPQPFSVSVTSTFDAVAIN